ncbi:2Fe-2S iron-sulfur cluster-binding protein [Marinomonas algicola]|jgi:ferredoxin|uniref:2Fe-2S iron-sulfur cluster-binding protein n=1 Tax=Marinomonas algicola TaxID=2773454 RepID=UPI00174A2375|nr:2Fe-2S iron-sulfur cluster binding domain-containing protein [Marinomonas algicola]
MLHKCIYSINTNTLEVFVDKNATILDALIKRKLYVKKACINGACGICLMQLTSGDIDYDGRIPRGLNNQEISQGYILPCIAKCKSNITLEQRNK